MKEFAPGIPEDRKIHSPRKASKEIWRMVVQKHPAERAGDHYDLRIGDPEKGIAYSWATKKKLPAPGSPPIGVYEQPSHTLDYMDYQGAIESTYGKTRRGEGVRKVVDETIEVLRAGPDQVRFNVYKPGDVEEFILNRSRTSEDPKVWNLINITHDKSKLENVFEFKKPRYRQTPIGSIDLSDPSQVMSAKLDGGHNIIWLRGGNRPRLFSHRPGKKSKSGVIEQTHKIEDLYNSKVPREFKDTTLRGEIYGLSPEGDRPIPAELVSGMLNAGVLKSRDLQKEYGALRVAAFDVEKFKGEDVRSLGYKEKLDILNEIRSKISGISVPEVAFSEEDKRSLLDLIKNKEYADTHEGVVLWPSGGGRPTKAKFNDTFKVFIRDMDEAIDKNGEPKGEMGSLSYSMTPRGPIVGRVGTGFSSSERKRAWKDRSMFLNKWAYVKAQVQYDSGALGKPSFAGLEKVSSLDAYINKV